jgi:hypothetical protein
MCRQRGLAAGDFGAGVEDVAQALHGNGGLLEVGPQLRQAHDGVGRPGRQHVEGDQLADGELAFNDQLGAHIHDGDSDQLADQRNDCRCATVETVAVRNEDDT